jgi:hypothetical protein
MNGVSGLKSGFPATTVIRISAGRCFQSPPSAASAETLLAAVRYPPRTAEVTPLSALLPQVLAKYGLDLPPTSGPSAACQLDHEGALA